MDKIKKHLLTFQPDYFILGGLISASLGLGLAIGVGWGLFLLGVGFLSLGLVSKLM